MFLQIRSQMSAGLKIKNMYVHSYAFNNTSCILHWKLNFSFKLLMTDSHMEVASYKCPAKSCSSLNHCAWLQSHYALMDFSLTL